MTKAERKYCAKSRNWFKPARRNGGVNELYLWNETFRFGALFAWPVNTEQMHKVLKFYKCEVPGSELSGMGAKHIWDSSDDRHFVFFTSGSLKTDAAARNISHECLHVVCAALQRRNIPLSDGSEEMYAYLLGWLVGEAMGRIQDIG